MQRTSAGLLALMCMGACALMLSACKPKPEAEQLLPGLNMVSIPAGTFQMGRPSPNNETSKDGPVHAVTVKAFKLASHEVTLAQFRAFATPTNYKSTAEQGGGSGANGCRVLNSGLGRPGTRAAYNWQDPAFPQTETQPVVCVSQHDALAFITWLNKQTGRTFRLPSEAEWEYAAQANSQSVYYWGKERSEVCKYENTSDITPDPLADAADSAGRSNAEPADVGVGGPPPPGAAMSAMSAASTSSGSPTPGNPPPQTDATGSRCSDGYFYTAPAGRFMANAFGLYDMLGNVRERVADCWHENFAGAPSDGSAWSANCSKPEYVARGGSWTFLLSPTAGNRGNVEAAGSNDNLGFRLAED